MLASRLPLTVKNICDSKKPQGPVKFAEFSYMSKISSGDYEYLWILLKIPLRNCLF